MNAGTILLLVLAFLAGALSGAAALYAYLAYLADKT